MRHWIVNCRKISRMVSDALDRKLPFHQRVGIRMHLLMCRYCARNRRQQLLLRMVLQQYEQRCVRHAESASLPEDARNRIQAEVLQNCHLQKP